MSFLFDPTRIPCASLSLVFMDVERFLWIDLEMSGLDVSKEVIIEVAAIVTNLDFCELDQYHCVVKQGQQYIDNMDAWNRKTHKRSGLIEEIPHGKSLDQVERDLITLTDKHFKGGSVIIAGSSISQDRLFINKYLLNFKQRLHYRMLDVTAFKVVFQNKFGRTYKKKNAHRALDDVRESIEELKYYLKFFVPA